MTSNAGCVSNTSATSSRSLEKRAINFRTAKKLIHIPGDVQAIGAIFDEEMKHCLTTRIARVDFHTAGLVVEQSA